MYRPERTMTVPVQTLSPATAAVDDLPLPGKGYFVEDAARVLAQMGGRDVGEVARVAVDAGIQHVIMKIADGGRPFPAPGTNQDRVMGKMLDALRRAGITVWGWTVLYGAPVSPQDQARALAQRARQWQMPGLVLVIPDDGADQWSGAAGAARARQYVTALREELVPLPAAHLAFSPHPLPARQPDFPFAPFLDACDIVMPHVYWVARGEGDAMAALQAIDQKYNQLCPEKLLIPVGAACGQVTGARGRRYFWSASPRQLVRFMDQARVLGMPAFTFWRWELALRDPHNQRYNGAELWDAIAAYPLPPRADAPRAAPPNLAREIGVDQPGYHDGLYPQFPAAALTASTRREMAYKYAVTVADTPSSVWALWQPPIAADGFYDIGVWVPGEKATTRQARYQIHGVQGESGPLVVTLNQSRFNDEWVSLGVYELDAQNPLSGRVNLTNYTGERERWVAFSSVRWRPAAPPDVAWLRLADGFDAPVGTAAERSSGNIWPGGWIDANPFGSYYRLRASYAYHTGADLNLNTPHWDSDRGQPVYAIASGEVTFAGWLRYWGNVVVVRHDPVAAGGAAVYSRCAHLASMTVRRGQRVQRGQQVGVIGQDAQGGPFHLHFDISPTEILWHKPGDWPGLDRGRLLRDYVDPRAYLRAHRPPPDRR